MSRIIERVQFGFTGFDEISLLYYDENNNLIEARKLNREEYSKLIQFILYNKNIKNQLKIYLEKLESED